MWDFVGKAKWQAWKDLGEIPQEKAMQDYADLVDHFAPSQAEGASLTGAASQVRTYMSTLLLSWV